MSARKQSAESDPQQEPLDEAPPDERLASSFGGVLAVFKRGLNNLGHGLQDAMSSNGVWGLGAGVALLLLGAGPLGWAIMAVGAAVMARKAMKQDQKPQLPSEQSPAADRSPNAALETSHATPLAALGQVASYSPAAAGQATARADLGAAPAERLVQSPGLHYRDARFNSMAPASHRDQQAGHAVGHNPAFPVAFHSQQQHHTYQAPPGGGQGIAGAHVAASSSPYQPQPHPGLHYTADRFNTTPQPFDARAPQVLASVDRAPAAMM